MEQYLQVFLLHGFGGMHEYLGFSFTDFVMLSKQTVALNFCLCVLSWGLFASGLKVRHAEYVTETCVLVGK